MSRGRLAVTFLVVILVVLGLGFGWGSRGRATAEHALEETRQQVDVAEARGHILDARVSLYNVNFGDAQRQLEDAKPALQRMRERYLSASRRDAADAIAAAVTHLQEAQRLAAKLDPAANNQANEALNAIKAATGK